MAFGDALDRGYFHVVFTIPEAQRALLARERRVMYGPLMVCVGER